ncbi:hypothetical protein P1X14_13755 [Sphingomonas sp. AOB5]|uniref:hypothetical protein n=1 Tax=Sphingomonas sp. AOB5 TaxID=3034017 RepID=UPI0023F7130A|nr:hypothetical protein [Sphingomonas sp. AOB5]MDF7776316.1 hypothetical protein [Sphingomonas sp. AOB5]
MIDLNDDSWIGRSVPAADPELRICFMVSDHFYIGDPNDWKQLDDPAYRQPLAPPEGIDRFDTRSVLGHESALAAHYRDIVERAVLLDCDEPGLDTYFWMRLWISAGGAEACSFPWYDTWREMERVFDWLKQAGDGGEEWFDIDQGWMSKMVRRGERFHLYQADPDDGEEYANLEVDRAQLLASAARVRDEISVIIPRLTAALGFDAWTEPGDLRTDCFGTPDWNPARLRGSV